MKSLLNIILFIFVFQIISCKEAPPFPASRIYEQLPGQMGCTAYEIIKENPLTVGDGVDLEPSLCPMSIMGFDINEVGDVTNWIRDMQEIVEKRCK